MRKSTLVVLLVLVAAAAGALLVWWGGDAHGLPDLAAPASESQQRAASADPLDAFGTLATGGVVAPRGELSSGAGVRIEMRGEQAPRALVVQVWDGEAGVPAATAEVFVLDGFEGPELRDPFAQHWSALAESRGVRFQTDVQGRVELPPVQEWAILTARRPGAYGFAKVGREHRDVESITLQPDATVTVRVVDGEGHTVSDIPVGVVQHIPWRVDPQKLRTEVRDLERGMAETRAWMEKNPGQRERAAPRVEWIQTRLAEAQRQLAEVRVARQRRGRRGRQGQPPPVIRHRVELRAKRRTDAHGLAVFRHFQVHREPRQRWWPREQAEPFEAVLLMPMQRAETVAFAGSPLPDEPIELRMPPTGSVVLRTVDRDGRPFMHPVHADLRVVGGEAPVWSRRQIRKEQGETEIEFAHVGLGLQLEAHCRLDDEDFKWSAPPFGGPSQPLEQVVVDLIVAPNEGMLVGRLIDGAGEPLAGASPTFLLNSPAGRLEGEEVALDANGRFHLPYQLRPHHRGPFRFEVRRHDVSPTAGLAMTLPALAKARVTDLGDLQIDAFGRVAHGVVVDDRDEPIEGAEVQLQRERDVGGDQPELAFVDEAFSAARSDGDGRYELFGELEPGRHRLRAEAKDHFPAESADLRRGAATVLKLERKARVVGTVLAPEWMPRQGLRARLVSTLDPEQVREDQIHDYQGKTYIYFDWIKPGTYDLTLRVREFPDPFFRIEGLRLEPGQHGLHPRLTDVDLSAYLHRFEVFARDENGSSIQPDRPLLARITRPDGRTTYIGFPWRRGRVEMLSASPQVDVMPLSTGYVAEPTVLGAGRSDLQFLAIPPVDLVTPGLRALVGATQVRMVMELLDTEGLPEQLDAWDGPSKRISGWFGRAKYGHALLGDNDTTRVGLIREGRHRVFALFGGRGTRPVRVEFGEVEVQLVPGAGPLRVGVTPDPALVQQGMAELAQRQAATGNGK